MVLEITTLHRASNSPGAVSQLDDHIVCSGQYCTERSVRHDPSSVDGIVARTAASRKLGYRILSHGRLTDKHKFADQGSDGLTLDEHGYLDATDRGVTVVNPEGERILSIQTPQNPANLVFGGKDGKTLLITARTSLYAIRMNAEGVERQQFAMRQNSTETALPEIVVSAAMTHQFVDVLTVESPSNRRKTE